jgi:uncharacterized protein YrrD
MQDAARAGRDLLGLPVLSITEGKRIGQVSALLVRREDRTVAAIGISGAGSGARHLPFAEIKSVGPDAVMVESESVLQAELPAAESRDLEGALPGRSVVTESGQRLGEVTGFAVDVGSGRIESYHVRADSGLLARLVGMVRRDEADLVDSLVIRMGDDALIVRDEAAQIVAPVSAGEPSDPAEP